MRLVIVSATRYSEQEFWQFCPLGQSLSRLSFDSRIRSLLAYSNQAGLSQVYNHRLSLMQEDETALFIHDDAGSMTTSGLRTLLSATICRPVLKSML
jgi:hypothetical protein